MKKEIKRTPITFNGVDGWEVFIKDDEIQPYEHSTCERCMYQDWHVKDYILASCEEVHGCTWDFRRYFIFEPFDVL